MTYPRNHHGPHGTPRRPSFDRYDSPEARAHAKEADEVRETCERVYGFTPEKVAPTGDGRGHLRLNFEQFYKLIYEPDEGDDTQEDPPG